MENWLLLAFFLVYFTAAFVWRSWLVWRSTGVNPYVLPSSDDPAGYVAKAFRAVLLALGAYAAAQAVWPEIDAVLGWIAVLDQPALHVAGWSLLLGALVWTCIAQMQMGLSWRIGIDLRNDTPLVRNGLFAVSRNPIFLAMRGALYGLLLVRPNSLTLTLAVTGDLLMQMQTRQEEAFLRERHGESYARYCAETPRWI